MNAPAPVANPFQINAAQRAMVLNQAIEMKQVIYSGITDPTKSTQINIVPRNVGLIKKFIVEVSATMTNTDGALGLTLTDLGVANLLSRVTFTDLANNVRIDTAGWHLAAIAAAKYQSPLGSVITDTVSGQGYGNNFPVVTAPATIAFGASGTVKFIYEIPLAYSDEDLRGSVFAGVVNAVMQLQLNLNTTPAVAAATDSTLAIYKGTAAGALSNVNINVYQVYLDQLPVGKNGLILPQTDIATVYELKKTAFAAMVAGNEFPIPYANFRDFLSTCVIYNHDSSADAGRVGGSDISYWALQSANFTNIWKQSPAIAALDVRKLLAQDFPLGFYYFSSRKRPISTDTYGNMQLILNPSAAAASAYALVGWEDFAITNTLKNSAGSLAG